MFSLSGRILSLGPVFAAVVVCHLPAGKAQGQVSRIEGGRALDASRQIGSGGINAPGTVFIPNQSNLLITGNVSGLHSFHGYSPIRDSSQLFTPLPSSDLSAFNRASAGSDDVPYGGQIGQRLPYFSRSQTVTDVGGITQGRNAPGSSVPLTPDTVPRYRPLNAELPSNALPALPSRLEPLDLRQFAPSPLGPVRLGDEDRRVGPVNAELAESPLFQRIQKLENRLRRQQSEGKEEGNLLAGDNLLSPPGIQPAQPGDRLSGPEGALYDGAKSTLLDTRAGNQLDGRVLVEPAKPAQIVQEPLTARGQEQPEPGGVAAVESIEPINQPVGRRASAETQVQGNVFRGMRMAVSSLPRVGPSERQPGQASEGEKVAGALEPASPTESSGENRESPKTFKQALDAIEAATATDEKGLETKANPFRKFFEAPVKTFVGTERSGINAYLEKAEAYLKKGNYYRAEAVYDVARVIEPSNPLPLLGKAHAMLGAGEYLSASRQLLRAVELFPQVALFMFDLRSMMEREDELDIRRADLEKLLESRDNPNLRFLLGYVEFYSGLGNFGLANMTRAADSAGKGSPMARFVEMIREGQRSLSGSSDSSEPGKGQP